MADTVMSDLEAIVYNYLIKRNIPFDFQTALAGGHFQLGGSVVDFILIESNIALRCQGEYWHRGIEKTGSDIIQKEQLAAMGYTVVDLLADDLENRPNETLSLAIQGIEMLR